MTEPFDHPELPDHDFEREVGRGGMGTAFLYRNRLLDRPEVLKVLAPEVLARPGNRERFDREIQAAARLSHPNIVAAYAALRLGEGLGFLMEFVDGKDLAKVVLDEGPLPPGVAVGYAVQVLAALQHAYENGMVHRDIKPSNLMRTTVRGRTVIKVLDFGLARSAADQKLTLDGQVLGTPDFISPEQSRDTGKADIRSDLYSLGCTLFFLLLGRGPFVGDNLLELFEKHRDELPPPLDRLRPGLPAGLSTAVNRLLEKDPRDRPQTPADAIELLAPFAAPGTSSHPILPKIDTPAKRLRRVPGWLPVVAAAGLFAVIAVVAYLSGGTPTPATPPITPTPPTQSDDPPPPPPPPAPPPPPPPSLDEWVELIGPNARPFTAAWQVGAPHTGPLPLALDGGATGSALLLDWAAGDCEVLIEAEATGGGLLVRASQPNAYLVGLGDADGAFAVGAAHRWAWGSGPGKLLSGPDPTLTPAGAPVTLRLTAHGPKLTATVNSRPAVDGSDADGFARGKVGLAVRPGGSLRVRRLAVRGNDGFVPLLKDSLADGWVHQGRTHGCTLADGVLSAVNPRRKGIDAHLLTAADYADFVLRFEYWVEDWSGALVSLRADPRQPPNPQKADTVFHSWLFVSDPKEKYAPGTLDLIGRPRKPPDEPLTPATRAWHPVRVTARGPSVLVEIDRVPVNQVREPGLARTAGRIGFTAYSGTAKFREVEVKELAPAAK